MTCTTLFVSPLLFSFTSSPLMLFLLHSVQQCWSPHWPFKHPPVIESLLLIFCLPTVPFTEIAIWSVLWFHSGLYFSVACSRKSWLTTLYKLLIFFQTIFYTPSFSLAAIFLSSAFITIFIFCACLCVCVTSPLEYNWRQVFLLFFYNAWHINRSLTIFFK